MNVRKKLVLLLSLFAVYAVIAAATAIVGTNLRVRRAAERFESIAGQTTRVEELELHLTEQEFLLAQLVEGRAEAMEVYGAARRVWTDTLQQCRAFAHALSGTDKWSRLDAAAGDFENASNEFLELIEDDRHADAKQLLEHGLREEILPALRSDLVALKTRASAARDASARALSSGSALVLLLTVGVAVLAALLVAVGAFLVRRWLLGPITHLQGLAGQFRKGDLSRRSELSLNDELTELGVTLNEMAQALDASQRKHRTLFANLQDAVVLCDRDGRIVEYHDGDSRILGVDGAQHVGRPLLQVWPEWRDAVTDWGAVLHAAIDDGRRLRVHDVKLGPSVSSHNGTFADFVVYRVDGGDAQYAAVVIRDATQRRELQDRLRHAETMEAIGTMAGGLAHDVNNLLSGVTGSLTALTNDLADPKQSERIAAALKSCRRAAGLTKRLLNFARGLHGTPQVFQPGPVIRAVIESVDQVEPDSPTLRHDLDDDICIRMDQDQFTQVVMNLVDNARDACAPSGSIEVSLRLADVGSTEGQAGPRRFALLTVEDDGSGMSPEIEARIFEPFFTTKARADARGRGMGLAMVYAAVKSAGGHTEIKSQPGVGTTVSVYILACDPQAAARHNPQADRR